MKQIKNKTAFIIVNRLNPRIDVRDIYNDTDVVLGEDETWMEVEIKVLSTVIKTKARV